MKSRIDTLPLDQLAGRKLVQTNYGDDKTLNIKLAGIGHHDYFRRPGQTYGADSLVPVAEEIIARLAKLTESGYDIKQYALKGANVVYDSLTNTYSIDNLEEYLNDIRQI